MLRAFGEASGCTMSDRARHLDRRHARSDVVPADDRGLQYGDGVFETDARAREARALSRRTPGAAVAGLHAPRHSDSLRWRYFARKSTQRVALSARRSRSSRSSSRAGSAQRRGYAPQGNETPRRVRVVVARTAAGRGARDGVDSARGATIRLRENPALAGIKHLNRLENVLAAAEPPGTAHSSP